MENKLLGEDQVLEKQVFRALLQQRNIQDTIRIWCPACGTGEGVITLLVKLLEMMQAKNLSIPIQIFATDTNEEGLKKARTGIYAADALQQLTAKQLKHFFIKTGKLYQAITAIRDVCIFATHNVLTDPPFPRLDIIYFQNNLALMSADDQQQVLRSFHFGLKAGGFLLLSDLETVPVSPWFSPLAQASQVYIRNFPLLKTARYDDWQTRPIKSSHMNPPLKSSVIEPDETTSVEAASKKLLLARYVPASIIINDQYKIVRFHGPVQKYLQPASGRASLSILSMLPDDLAFDLQDLVQQLGKTGGIYFRRKDVLLHREEEALIVTVEVTPIQTANNPVHYLIVLKEKQEPAFWEVVKEPSQQPEPADKEASITQGQLKTLTEEYNRIREDWQVAHEEMTANFEEIQAANEALELNKQELQAAVKKLMLANEELEVQNISLSDAADLSGNLLEAIRDPLILLNTNLSVHAANKIFYSTFKLTPADVEGRFMYEIANSQWNVPELLAKLSEVVSRKNGHATFEVPFADNQMLLFNAVHIENSGKRNDRILISIQDVTHHRQARDAKEWLAAVVESSNEGIISFTTNKTIISWNKGAEEIFGYTEAEMVGKSLTRLVKLADKVGQHKLIERVMKGEVVRQLEMEHIHKDGHTIFVSTSVALIKDQRGNIKGMMASVQDITERKKAVEALRESEERFRPIVSQSAVGIVRIDFNGKMLFVNQNFCDLLQFSAEELLSKTIWDINYANQIERTKHLLKQVQEAGEPVTYEKQLIRKDNTPVWVSINLSAIKDLKGVPFSATAIIIDISQRREAEVALQQAKDSLQMAQEAANMGSWEMDLTTGQILYHNLRNDQLMGYGVWQPEWNLTIARYHVIEEDKAVFDEAITRMLSTGRLNMEVRVKWPDNSIHWIYKAGQIAYDTEGKPLRAAGIGMDITSHKLAEQRKEAFLGIASHELKTPVTSIKAYAQILQERFVEAEDYNSALLITKLDRQVDKLTNLIKDLLDTTRITEGQLSLRKGILDLNGLVQEIADDLQPGYQSHKIIKKLHPLPPIQADKERIRQVLINLITNAIKYSPQSNKVVICSESDDKQITIRVQDYGMGIPEEMQEHIFERFFRVGNGKSADLPGMGLGLFISSEIIRQHKGNIWVESEEGAGATFGFSLPLEDSNGQQATGS